MFQLLKKKLEFIANSSFIGFSTGFSLIGWFENNRGDPVVVFLEFEFDEFVNELFEFRFLA